MNKFYGEKIYGIKGVESYVIDKSCYYPHELVLLENGDIYIYHDNDGDIDTVKVENIHTILDYLEEQTNCKFDKKTTKLVNKAIKECEDKDSEICGYLFMLDLEIRNMK